MTAVAFVPGRSTRRWSRDHRLVVLASRARARVERRALLVLAATAADQPLPEPDQVARWDHLITQADELYVRLSGMPPADAERRRAWRRAT